MSIVERTGMSLDAFLRRYDEQPFELLDGEAVPMSPKVFGSDFYAWRLQRALDRYFARAENENNLPSGYVFVETTFVLPDTPSGTWVIGSRQPDVMYISQQRLDAYRSATPDWKLKPLMLVPDLAIEIVSPTDRMPKVWRKAAIYLEDSVELVWVVNPMRRSVTTFEGDLPPMTLNADQVLEGGALLPGFALPLYTLFQDD